MKSIKTLVSIVLTMAATAALAVGPSPAPMKQKEVLTIGYVKVGHLSPMLMLEEELKKLNIEVKRAEFVRYADARTALLSGSVDVSAVGPGDLAIVAAQGSKNLIGLTGVGSSSKFLVVRKGVKIDDWADINGKKIAIAPGSSVWFQWAMTLIEKNIPYTAFSPVNVQGGGTAFQGVGCNQRARRIGQDRASAPLQGGLNKISAVTQRARQRGEQIARNHGAAVQRQAADARIAPGPRLQPQIREFLCNHAATIRLVRRLRRHFFSS